MSDARRVSQRAIVDWFDSVYLRKGAQLPSTDRCLFRVSSSCSKRGRTTACSTSRVVPGSCCRQRSGLHARLHGVDVSQVAYPPPVRACRCRNSASRNGERLPYPTIPSILITCLGSLERDTRSAARARRDATRRRAAARRYCFLVRNSNTRSWKYLARLAARQRAASHADADTLHNWTAVVRVGRIPDRACPPRPVSAAAEQALGIDVPRARRLRQSAFDVAADRAGERVHVRAGEDRERTAVARLYDAPLRFRGAPGARAETPIPSTRGCGSTTRGRGTSTTGSRRESTCAGPATFSTQAAASDSEHSAGRARRGERNGHQLERARAGPRATRRGGAWLGGSGDVSVQSFDELPGIRLRTRDRSRIAQAQPGPRAQPPFDRAALVVGGTLVDRRGPRGNRRK